MEGTYVIHDQLASLTGGINEVNDPETSAVMHEKAGLPILAETANERAAARVHYEPLGRDDAENWRREFDYQYALSDFNDNRLALPVVAVLGEAREQPFFDRIEVWMRSPHKSRNPEVAFVGIIDQGSWNTTYAIIAQWSPREQPLTTSAMLRERHCTLHRPFIAVLGFPRKAQVAFGACVTLLGCGLLAGSWEFTLAAAVCSAFGWICGKPLANGDAELADDIYVAMALNGFAAAAATILELVIQ